MLARESILKISISKWRAYTRGINVRSNIFTRLDAFYRVTKKASTFSAAVSEGSRYRLSSKSSAFPPASPARRVGNRNRHSRGYRRRCEPYVVFTNVISAIMGHPVSVQRRVGRPIASLLEMISAAFPCFSLDSAVTKADGTWDYAKTRIKTRWLKDTLKFATATSSVSGAMLSARKFRTVIDGRWKWNRELIRIDF